MNRTRRIALIRTILFATAALVLAPLPGLAGDFGSSDFEAWEPVLARHPLTTRQGETVTIQEMRGDVVVVNFWASWCKPCKRELVELDAWSRNLDSRRARILAISIDRDEAKATRFVDRAGLGLPVFLDGADGLASELDLPSLPCTVVLDEWGRVVTVRGGGDERVIREIREVVDGLLSNRRRLSRSDEGVSG